MLAFPAIRKAALALALSGLMAGGLADEAWAGKDCPGAPVVNAAAKSLMRAAASGTPQGFASAVARFSSIERLALYALGPYRSKLPKARHNEYVQRTRAFIGKMLAENAGRFNGDGMTIAACRASGKTLTVETRLSGGEKVVWRLAGNKGRYRIEDVSVQRVWLAQQLRTTFMQKIRQNGNSVDALIDQLG